MRAWRSRVCPRGRFACSVSITESQNGRGWKGPLWVTQSNPPAEAESPTAGCTGPCQDLNAGVSRSFAFALLASSEIHVGVAELFLLLSSELFALEIRNDPAN